MYGEYATTYSLSNVPPGIAHYTERGHEYSDVQTSASRSALFQEEWGGKVTEANSLMEQALAAARSGDRGAADEFKAQAEALLEGAPTYSAVRGRKKKSWHITGGVETSSSDVPEALQSTTGMTMGELVYQGREFLDPESRTSQRFMESLTAAPIAQVEAGREAGMRSLATGERGAVRQQRDFGMARGGLRQPGQEAAIAARTGEQFAGQRASFESQTSAQLATIKGEAAKFYEGFSRQFSASVLDAADEWVSRRAEVEDSFRDRIANLSVVSAQISGQFAGNMIQSANTAMASYSQRKAAEAAADDGSGGWVGTALGVVSMVAGLVLTATGVGATVGPLLMMGGAGMIGGSDY
jgi:hypothetical protein